jgi:hypothetical protein
MPSGNRGRRCCECPSVFITRSPTQPLCPACRKRDKAFMAAWAKAKPAVQRQFEAIASGELPDPIGGVLETGGGRRQPVTSAAEGQRVKQQMEGEPDADRQALE